MNYLITYMFMGLEHEKKDKVQVPQRNELLSLYCTALGFVSKNEEYNSEKNISNSFCKIWYYNKLLSNRK